jgi:hypothetical protein
LPKGHEIEGIVNNLFFILILARRFYLSTKLWYKAAMFYSIPFTPRKIEATEARLHAIYDAAKLGLHGDALALAAGMLPTEFRQLTQLDPIAEMAELKGRADGELEMSQVLHTAARQGDAKAALEILKHQHGWVAKQQINVDVEQRISITQALEQAQTRVLEIIENEVIDQPMQLEHTPPRRQRRVA